MIYRLVILNGDRKGQQITVPEDPLTIGRGKECGLCLNDPEIATAHARVTHTAQGLGIVDLGSMGKVLVNNHGVRESTLRHGDIVELGHTRLLVQAVVEAEVRGAREPNNRRRRRLRAALMVTLATLTLVVMLEWGSDQPKGTEITLPKAAKAVAGAATNYVVASPEAEPLLLPPVVAPVAAESTAVAVPETLASSTPIEPPTAVMVPSGMATTPVAEGAAPPPEPLAPPVDIGPVSVAEEVATANRPDPYALAQAMIDEKVRGMMLEVSALVDAKRLAEADELLNGVQHLAPDYVDAYVERAWLCEDRGLLDPAIAQWQEVIRHGAVGDVSKTAREKTARLARARNEITPKFGGRIRIKSADQKKFPDSAQVREMRVVTVFLMPGDPMQVPDAKATRVDVLFYDRDLRTDRLSLSRATGKARDLAVSSPWREGEEKSVTATYMIPASMTPASGRSEQFQGYVVRVYYYGALQAVQADPPSLLARITPDRSVVATTRESPPGRATTRAEP
ncbi:MAG: FHA domain-containing protein [Lentisphaerae bacterium]|nr:FHA domain-containing protein [Lentisphaerota bacterium]